MYDFLIQKLRILFVKAVQNITKEVFADRRLLFGLYVSRLRPFEDNIELMAQHNIECINDFFSMEKVIEECYARLQQGCCSGANVGVGGCTSNVGVSKAGVGAGGS
jgi:hypothetical protein